MLTACRWAAQYTLNNPLRLANNRDQTVHEIHWAKIKGADSFLTVIYQIDRNCRRLSWVGKRPTPATLRRGLAGLAGPLACKRAMSAAESARFQSASSSAAPTKR